MKRETEMIGNMLGSRLEIAEFFNFRIEAIETAVKSPGQTYGSKITFYHRGPGGSVSYYMNLTTNLTTKPALPSPARGVLEISDYYYDTPQPLSITVTGIWNVWVTGTTNIHVYVKLKTDIGFRLSPDTILYSQEFSDVYQAAFKLPDFGNWYVGIDE